MKQRDDLPPPLMTSEPGSFARKTILERKPQIIAQVSDVNGYPQDILDALVAFREEIAARPIQPLHEDTPDSAFWNAALAPYAGRTWLEVPWYFAETFFYRRLLEAVRYLQPGPWQGFDPFRAQKKAQERAAVAQLTGSWLQIDELAPEARLELLLHAALWGNRADLSNFTVTEATHDGLNTHLDRHHILIDHTDEACTLLLNGLGRVDFINDNVGADTLFDLVLADFLLGQDLARQVVFHLKNRPFFVSDAMPQDIRLILARMRMLAVPLTAASATVAPASEATAALEALGHRLQRHVDAQRLWLRPDPFWTRCLGFRALPPALQEELAQADLVVLKGDVNYRRLLDDRHWPHTTPLEAAAADIPRPFLVLRTLKGEIMVGLAPGQAEALAAKDPQWLINGKRGICQLVTAE